MHYTSDAKSYIERLAADPVNMDTDPDPALEHKVCPDCFPLGSGSSGEQLLKDEL